MPTAHVNGIDIYHETLGDPADPAVLMIMGIGAQLIQWPDGLCEQIAASGFWVIRYDNRDTGLSTKLDGQMPAISPGTDTEPPSLLAAPPYTMADMAQDAVSLLDELGVDEAHIVGASLGGIIAQRLVINHPTRALTLTSIMSGTGEPGVGTATQEVTEIFWIPAPAERDANIEHAVRLGRAISGPLFNETNSRKLAARRYDRCFYPEGRIRQFAAVIADGDRTEELRGVRTPTLVIHGAADPLISLPAGEATAAAIPGAELLVLDDMGHDLPERLWPEMVAAFVKLASSS